MPEIVLKNKLADKSSKSEYENILKAIWK
jgi:hypothetical protein